MKIKLNKITIFAFFALSINHLYSQNINDIQKLRKEYERMQKRQLELPISNEINQNENDYEVDDKYIKSLKILDFDNIDSYENTKHFGYSFFNRRDSIKFFENVPVPSNYVVGPGDEIIVTIWGETEIRRKYQVDIEGRIYDEKIGILSTSGKTLSSLQTYLKKQFGRVYSTLTSNPQSSYLDVSLGKKRSINVNFVGHVRIPGVFAIHPFSNIISGLIQSGGIDTTGSLRTIYITRNEEKFLDIDLYKFFLEGKPFSNLQLRDDDVVVVPPRVSTVSIDSAVQRPGFYEILENESIEDLINYAGGLKYSAGKLVSVNRIGYKKDTQNSSYRAKYFNVNETANANVENGDIVIVYSHIPSINKVEIIGQVKSPGIYSYYSGMGVKELIEIAQGYDDSTYWESVYKKQGEIIRVDKKSRYENVIKFNVDEVLNGADIKLKNLDKIVVHANLNFFEKRPILILGEVNIPGAYPLIKNGNSLSSVINRAGGLTDRALKNGISIYRDQSYFEDLNLIVRANEINTTNRESEASDKKKTKNNEKIRVAWSNKNIVLMPGDSIIVKATTGSVNVKGEVYNPGMIEFIKGKSVQYYVDSAGGLTEEGNPRGIVVISANGIVVPNKWYKRLGVGDGSTIVINKKQISEPFDLTQFATNWTSIISSMITAIVLSRQLGV
tara:strand:+ start:2705 stop:4714 length:2010 start_codon:yes stop_codon:yes gene_type:complete